MNLVRAVLLGLLAWLIPFVVAVGIFPLREAGAPLFETVMGVTVTASAVIALVLYAKKMVGESKWELPLVGLVWFAICFLVDLFMFSWGPMAMTFTAFVADVGLIYLIMPIVTSGMGFVLGCHASNRIAN